MSRKDYTLQAKIIKRLNQLYPTTRINSIERLTKHDTYYAVKCNVTFTNAHWDDVSTFFICKEDLDNENNHLHERPAYSTIKHL